MRIIFTLIIVFSVAIALSISRVFDKTIQTTELPFVPIKPLSNLDKVLFKHLSTLKKRPTLLKNFIHNPQEISTTGFWVDKTEVRQGDFYKFIGWHRINKTYKRKIYSSSKSHGLSGKLNVSANGVNFLDALAYCQNMNARLPTYNEVRLTSGNFLYPWGDEFKTKPWVYYDARLNATLKPNSFPGNNTLEGVADFGSMLAEWHMGDYPEGKPGIFGGNAHSRPYDLYALNAINRKASKTYRSPYVGFRCVYDKKPKTKSPWKSAINVVEIKAKTERIFDYSNSRITPILKYLSTLSLTRFKQLIQNKKNHAALKISGEIRVEQYQIFLNSIWQKIGIYRHSQAPKKHSDTPLNWQAQLENPMHAVVGVDFFSAYHFSNWMGGRLPSYQEMQSIFPKISHVSNTLKAHVQVAKPGDIQSLSNNASEWTASVDTANENLAMIVYGGSIFTEVKDKKMLDFYRSIPVQTRLMDVGFRVIF
jgi:formylglycine-generating enzyme required for sulfatase activity